VLCKRDVHDIGCVTVEACKFRATDNNYPQHGFIA